MNVIHPDASLVKLLQRIASGDVRYRLYDNDITPGPGSVLADFNEWSHADGYGSSILVAASDFTLSGVSGHIGFLTAGDISWTFTGGPNNCYGFFVTDSTGADLLAAARFDSAPIVVNAGTVITVSPKFANASKFAS